MQTRVKIIAAVSAAVVAAAGVTTGLVLSAGAGPDRPGGGPGSSPGSSPVVSPFTGEPVSGPRKVLAVKIDNLVDARPQTGLSRADIVYVLPVEGGLSRLMAVFSSALPPVIGPVRSARLEDLEVLRQFGRPAFAYSGAAPSALPTINRAPIVNLRDGLAHGYFRDSRRLAPHNLYAHSSTLQAQAGSASDAHSIGFRFGPAPRGGKPVTSESVSYPAASFRFTWSAARGRWLVWMDGARAASTEDGQLSAATVVIQYTQVTIPPATGPHAPTPFAKSTGSGRALVLRGGRVFQARWSRPAADDGTTFSTVSGQPMTFAQGPVWVVLAAR